MGGALHPHGVMMNKKIASALLISACSIGQAWAEPAETGLDDTRPNESSQTNNLVGKPSNEDPRESANQVPTGSVSVGNNQDKPPASQPITAEVVPQQASNLPLWLLAGLGVATGLGGLWNAHRSQKQVQEQIDQLRKLLAAQKNDAKKHTAEFRNDIESSHAAFSNQLKKLTADYRSMEQALLQHISSLQVNSSVPSVNKPTFDTLVINEKVEDIAKTDEDIVEMISEFVNPLLDQPQDDENVANFEKAYKSFLGQSYVDHYLMLKNTLQAQSRRYFDALVVVLKQPLEDGSRALVYLRSKTVQHSSISLLFENVSDGSRIHELIEPAYLKSFNLAEELSENHLVKKGRVTLLEQTHG